MEVSEDGFELSRFAGLADQFVCLALEIRWFRPICFGIYSR